jgi:hypothetical protein
MQVTQLAWTSNILEKGIQNLALFGGLTFNIYIYDMFVTLCLVCNNIILLSKCNQSFRSSNNIVEVAISSCDTYTSRHIKLFETRTKYRWMLHAKECMHKWVDQLGCHKSQFYLVATIAMPMLLYRCWKLLKWTWLKIF